jgi:hypothetical protein
MNVRPKLTDSRGSRSSRQTDGLIVDFFLAVKFLTKEGKGTGGVAPITAPGHRRGEIPSGGHLIHRL